MRRRLSMLWHRRVLRHRYAEDFTSRYRYRLCECGRRWWLL